MSLLWVKINFMGTLYLVATPIGNLEDMSPRAVRTLQRVRLIAAEDTRQTRKLLAHFDIHTPLTSYFEHNKLTKLDSILAELAQGDVALVSDAGMPAINDPGYELVKAALAAGREVVPVPGPSAALAALAVSGLPTDAFLYLGYLPPRAARRRRFLEGVRDLPYTLILLETPHRLLKALEDILCVLGDRRIAVAREMTKRFEEYWRGHVSQALPHFASQGARGEFTLVIEGQRAAPVARWSEAQLQDAIGRELRRGRSASQIAAALAKPSGWKRQDVYKLITLNK